MDFDAFVSARGPGLLQLAWLLTGHAQTAEDLVQSTLVDAYRHWDRVAAAAAPDAYVRKAMLNRHLTDRRRRWWGERPTDLDEAERIGALGGSDGPSDADHADLVATRADLVALVRGLPPRARAIVVLRYFEDRSDAQIGELLDVTESTVRATASRALATLRAAAVSTPEGDLTR
ncbi:MAG: SigE family RNA polymerase sigma factor [Nostocoides sp.]